MAWTRQDVPASSRGGMSASPGIPRRASRPAPVSHSRWRLRDARWGKSSASRRSPGSATGLREIDVAGGPGQISGSEIHRARLTEAPSLHRLRRIPRLRSEEVSRYDMEALNPLKSPSLETLLQRIQSGREWAATNRLRSKLIDHSARSACIGSIRAARRAGKNDARIAIANNTIAATENMNGFTAPT